MTRRSFLRIFSFLTPIYAFFGHLPKFLVAGKLEHSDKNFWEGSIFSQSSVDMSDYANSQIKAQIDGVWHTYPIREVSKAFKKWNISKRTAFIEKIQGGSMPNLGGPHSGMVATYGLSRFDSDFSINNAVKGIGLAPKDKNLASAIKILRDTFKQPMPEKMEILKSFYADPEFFDWRKQTSLELYSTPDFETHTFLNIMENPVAAIVFLDIPSFELRTIARIIHPDDQNVLPEEKNLLEFVNLVHDYMHGVAPRLSPLLLFYVVEEFDNSPGSQRGIRTIPPRPQE